MIDNKTLRIGNLVEYNGLHLTVIAIRTNDIFLDGGKSFFLKVNEINPIPITEESLVNMGFEKRNDLIFKEFHYRWNDPIQEDDETEELEYSINFNFEDYTKISIETHNEHGHYSDMPMPHIKYMHQLQNLYYSKTGEELEQAAQGGGGKK